MRNVTIYALCDPDTDEIRYIGQTTNIELRYKQHLSLNVISGKRKYDWVKGLSEQSKKPTIKVLFVVPKENANDAERTAIHNALAKGFDLVNGTENTSVARHRDVDTCTNTTVKIEEETRKKLKLLAALLDETMIVVIDKLVTEALEKAQARQQGASL